VLRQRDSSNTVKNNKDLSKEKHEACWGSDVNISKFCGHRDSWLCASGKSVRHSLHFQERTKRDYSTENGPEDDHESANKSQ
jgi:hypothetical protein